MCERGVTAPANLVAAARVVEEAYTTALKAVAERHAGSSPAPGTPMSLDVAPQVSVVSYVGL